MMEKEEKKSARFYNFLEKILFNEVFWILLLCFTFRNYFDKVYGTLRYNTDTASYCLAAQKLLHGFLDDYRTPLYPFILNLVGLFGNRYLFENVIILQQIVSFVSIIPFYLLAKKWFNNKPVSIIATLVYGCYPSIFRIVYGIFAESLLISLFIFFLWAFYEVVSKPSTKKWILFHVFIFIMVMLKPLCIVLYPVIFVEGLMLYWFNPQLKKKLVLLKQALLGFVVGVILLLGYCTVNKVQNDFWGVSTVSHDNNFANVVLSEAYYEIPDDNLISIIDTARYYGHYYTIYYLNNDFAKYQKCFAAFPSQYRLTNDMLGVQRIPPNNLGYDRKVLAPLVKKAMCSKTFVNYMFKDLMTFSNSVFFSMKGFVIYIIVYLELMLVLYELIFDRKVHATRLFVLLTGMSLLFASIVGGIQDGNRERVLLPVLPFLIYMFFDLINFSRTLFAKYLDYRKLKRMSDLYNL